MADKKGYYKDYEIEVEKDLQKRMAMRLHNMKYTKGISRRTLAALQDLTDCVVELQTELNG